MYHQKLNPQYPVVIFRSGMREETSRIVKWVPAIVEKGIVVKWRPLMQIDKQWREVTEVRKGEFELSL